MNKYLNLAKEEMIKGITNQDGGPFGAVIIDKKGNIISSRHNEVLLNKDVTAHAEINAIREACQKLNTIDLSDCILYTTCEPCPMCLSAIIWANIKEVYYGCTKEDAAQVGFKDKDIYDFIKGKNTILNLKKLDKQECLEIMKNYKGKLY